jgi:enamidase
MAPDFAHTLVVRNIGLVLSGLLEQPILDADTIVARDGRIDWVGRERDLDLDLDPGAGAADVVVDAHGIAAAPGLIDSHVHPVFGDWTPRQNQIGWIDSCLHGGVTTMISAGEVHLPGRPRDVVGVKALAIAAQRAFANFRPAGVKVVAGAPVVEHGMQEQDFADLAAAGVSLLGEVGLGSVKAAADAQRMVAWARKHGLRSTIHTGGPSIPGSGLIDKDVVLAADADVIGHINGGHTALPLDQITCLCEGCGRAIELVHNGNLLAALHALRIAADLGQLDRVILGTDAPAGSGAQPLGILRMIAMLASLGHVPAEVALCFATGNTARIHGLDRGRIAPGLACDLVLLDTAQHSAAPGLLQSIEAGDLPGVAMVIVDAEVKLTRSRNTPPATRLAEVRPLR